MSRVSSPNQKKHTNLTPSVKTLRICNLMNDLSSVKKFHEHKLLKLTPDNLQQLQSYEKMIKFILASTTKPINGICLNSMQNNTKKNLHSDPKKVLNHRKSNGSLNYQYNDILIDDKKISESEANAIYSGLFSQIEDDLRNWCLQFRMQTTDIMALFAKIKLSDQKISSKASKDISDIIEKYDHNSSEQKSLIFLNSNQNVLFQQKDELLYYNLNTLVLKSMKILTSLPFYTQVLNCNQQKQQENELKIVLQTICKNYNIVPYHNFTHGFAVFASFYDISRLKSVSESIDDFSLFFSLIACLSHDIAHPGNNTLLQVKIKSEIAITYGDISVMQKMHLARTMEILSRNPKTCQFFDRLSVSQQACARKIISRAIMATDMSKHYTFIQQLQNSLKKQKQGTNTSNKEQQSLFVIEVLIHGCDIQNPSFQYSSYLEWANLICLEFHMQTQKQSALKIEVTQFMKFDSISYFYRNQISFTSSIVLPLWQSLQLKFEDIQAKKITQRIKQNLRTLGENVRRNSQKPYQTKKTIQDYMQSRLEYYAIKSDVRSSI